MPGKSRRVHERRLLHPPSKRHAQIAQTRKIGGQRAGQAHILLFRTGRQLRHADVRKNTQSSAVHRRCSYQAHHRHAHPQSITGRGTASVGKRVQSNIDAPVQVEILLERHTTGKLHATGLNSISLQSLLNTLAMAALMSTEQKLRVGYGSQNLSPGPKRWFADLAEIVQAAERNDAPL